MIIGTMYSKKEYDAIVKIYTVVCLLSLMLQMSPLVLLR